MTRYRIGVDIGGTFTDLVLLGTDGSVATRKVSSTPDDYSRGIVAGIGELLAAARVPAASIDGIVHATTVATNAILEQRGARTALITTKGFRDVLEMRRLRIPELYNLQYRKPPPLVPRRLRFEVDERMGPRGVVLRALDEQSACDAADRIAAADVESVAICLLHAYANPAVEHRVAALLKDRVGARTGRALYITCSADILPELREYERTSTAVVNGYVGPIVERYLTGLRQRLDRAGLAVPLQIMQSNGGTMTAEAAIEKPAYIVESGPAAGVIACARIARAVGCPNAISFDMGGTTAKAAMIEDGEPARTSEYEVGAGINLSSKLVKGGGYAIKLPFIDVSEIGAGGGSIVAVDRLGSLQVGPRSAGAVPGPACYNLGGGEPTFTDAMVVLGYLNPRQLAGGSVALEPDRSRRAVLEAVATPLGLSLLDAAFGVYTIACANMTRAVKAVSTYRGRDPRDFVLFAFGGNGPVAAVEVARALDMTWVLVPPAPGVFSALGLLFSDAEQEFVATVSSDLAALAPADIAALFDRLERQGRAALAADGHAAAQITTHRLADLRYAGQAYELSVPVSDGPIDRDALSARFGAEHERHYGHRSDSDPVDLMTVRVIARARVAGPNHYDPAAIVAGAGAAAATDEARACYFGPRHGVLGTPILRRAALAGRTVAGPAVIEEYDATCVLPPGASATLDASGNIAIALG